MSVRNDIALIGLGVMGSNLALNIADHGYKIAVWNYTADLVEKFVKENPHPNAEAFTDLKEMVASLKRPRQIIIMVTAGRAVDAVIESLKPLLEPDDIVLDTGNSFYQDTMRRYADLKQLGWCLPEWASPAVRRARAAARPLWWAVHRRPTSALVRCWRPSLPRLQTASPAARSWARAVPVIS